MDVSLIELIDMYRNKLDNDRYSCLLFALQLPSICSRIEYPNSGEYRVYYNNNRGRPIDGELYRKWIKDHYSYFNKITKCFNVSCTDFADTVYDLRCNMTHACVTVDVDKLFNTNDDFYFCFIDDYDFRGTSLYGLGDVRFVSIYDFCQCMFNAASTIAVHNVSSSSRIYMSYSDYNELVLKYINKCYEILDERSDDAVLLLAIYEQIKLRRPELLDEIDLFFKENSDGVYNYRQGRKSGQIRNFSVDVSAFVGYSSKGIIVFEKAYDVPYIEGNINTNPTVTNLILTREQYDLMKLVYSEYPDIKKCARQSLIKQTK